MRVAVLMACAVTLAACAGGGASGADGPGSPTFGASLVIQGAITGLSGAGMVLQNNGAGDLTVSAPANSFLFEGIKEKSSYNITVKAQPTVPTQICTVTNGVGKIEYDPIRNVTMTCVTQSFAVRGSVVGLTATGLTLLLNDAGALPVAAGANSFAFPPIASGTRYAVTIGTQPAGQTCAVNGSGTVGASDVTSVTVTCGTAGGTIGGTVLGLNGTGLQLSLNGGEALPIPKAATAFTFPTTLQPGTGYRVTVVGTARTPTHSCMLRRGSGQTTGANVTDVWVWCHSNGTLDSYTGTYAVMINGRRNFLTLWFDGTYSLAPHTDDPGCANNGNGYEYGVYKRATDGTFWIQIASDDNGPCGIWNGGSTPGQGGGLSGTMIRNGNTLNLGGSVAIALEAVASVSTSLVGAFMRADGQDGSFIVFEADGTYLYQEVQATPNGHERGCYTVTGATFTTTLAAACRPNGFPSRDLNGTGGFSSKNGAPIPFTITSPTAITINGIPYTRMLPDG